MVRTARPSDLYRLPDARRAAPGSGGSEPPEPRRRFPAWLGVALVLATVLVVSGLIGTTASPNTGTAPLVDIVREDQAIAALALYGAQADAIAALKQREDIYALPGPRDAAMAARRGANQAQTTLDAARKVINPDPLVTEYVQRQDHATVTAWLAELAVIGDMIALLSLTQDTLYSGQGSIPLGEAHDQISSLVTSGGTPAALRAWGAALLDQMEDRPSAAAANDARAGSQRLWAEKVSALEPAAVPELRTYLSGLPPVMIQGLRGHPVAGPALKRLDADTPAPPDQ